MPQDSFPEFLLHLNSADFSYHLPDSAIAKYPLSERDASRLLVWKNGSISHHTFRNIANEIPKDCLLIINDTRVLPARLHFQKPGGAWIELLILEHSPGEFPGSMRCKAMVGNKKKWREGEVLKMEKDSEGEQLQLEGHWADREKDEIFLKWQPANRIFPEVLALWGEMPIPPYLNRSAEKSDLENYQTIYAQNPGAVAAPTAGLHFTEAVFSKLEQAGIQIARLTLHVGLGTFKPLKAEKVADHDMHPEEALISATLVEQLAAHKGPVIAVGTTSVRSLESLYWLGLECMETGQFPEMLESARPYQWQERKTSMKEVCLYLSSWMKEKRLDQLPIEWNQAPWTGAIENKWTNYQCSDRQSLTPHR